MILVALVFLVTCIPYFIIPIPPFPDYLGHLFMAYSPNQITLPYISNFHVSYQFTNWILILLKKIFVSPTNVSTVFMVLYSLACFNLFLQILRFFKIPKKALPFFLFLYPLAQYGDIYFFGNIPSTLTSIIWGYLIVYYFSHQQKFTLKNFYVLTFLLIIGFLTHPIFSIYCLPVLVVFLLQSIFQKDRHKIFLISLLIIGILEVTLSYYLKFSDRYGSFTLNKFIEFPIHPLVLWKRLVNLSYFGNIHYIYLIIPQIKSSVLIPVLSIFKLMATIATLVYIVKNTYLRKTKSNDFYLSLIFLGLFVMYFLVVYRYDNSVNFPQRTMDYFELFRFGILAYFLSKIIKPQNLNIFFRISLFSVSLFFSTYLILCLLKPGKNLPFLITKTTDLVLNNLQPGFKYSCFFNKDTYTEPAIIMAASLDPKVQNKQISVVNEWTDLNCNYLPVVWNKEFDSLPTRKIFFDYRDNDVKMYPLP